MHLLAVSYSSYKMRKATLDYFITSFCFPMVVPIHLVHSKFMYKNQHKTQLCCFLKSSSHSGSWIFWPRVGIGCCSIFRSECLLRLYPSVVTSFQPGAHLHGLFPPDWEPDASQGSTPYVFVWLTPRGRLPPSCAVLCPCYMGKCSCVAAVFDIKSEMNFRRFHAFY